jgi:phosphate uptake regulator
MKDYRRKLQIVAGSTYSLSLPKEWVQKLNLKPKQELSLSEQQDGDLLISPSELKPVKEKISISVDKYPQEIDQIFLALYYYGYNEIEFLSVKDMPSDIRNKIRKTTTNLSGAEITYEDRKTISIKINFDGDASNLYQIFYRINLIIEESIENIVGNFDWSEIKVNEDEIDRLYYLSMKIINSSLTDRSVLISSGIKNMKTIPSLSLIAKKLENIADNIKKIARPVEKENLKLKETLVVLPIIQEELNRTILYLMGKQKKRFERMEVETKERIRNNLDSVKHNPTKIYMERIYRYIRDIQDEVVTISFFGKLFSR